MIWDETQVEMPIGGNSDWLLGPNECQLESQCNLPPYDLAILWRQIETLHPGRLLVSPSVLSVWYLDDWWNAYVGLYDHPPRVDAIALHCYGDGHSLHASQYAAICKAGVTAMVLWAQEHGIDEIWVTEYAYLPCLPDGTTGSVSYMQEMEQFFESELMVTRYAWFQLSYTGNEPWSWGPYCNTSLVDFDTGELTVLGAAYD